MSAELRFSSRLVDVFPISTQGQGCDYVHRCLKCTGGYDEIVSIIIINENNLRLDVVLRIKEGYQNLTAACTLKV